MTFRLFALTLSAMLAFAGNSLLCRVALKQTAIDPTTFFAIRIVSGALMLCLLLALRRQSGRIEGTWAGALALVGTRSRSLMPIRMCLRARARCCSSGPSRSA